MIGVNHIFHTEEVVVLDSEPRDWRILGEKIISLRESLLKRITRHVEDDRNKKILAAMTLGFRQGLDREDKDVFMRSGMFHVFP